MLLSVIVDLHESQCDHSYECDPSHDSGSHLKQFCFLDITENQRAYKQVENDNTDSISVHATQGVKSSPTWIIFVDACITWWTVRARNQTNGK
jgi:hypothetical protein